MPAPRTPPTSSQAWTTRWPLGLALLCFVVATFFGARAGEDFERWVVTGLWFAVGLIWIVLWRMDVRRRQRALLRARPPAQDVGDSAES